MGRKLVIFGLALVCAAVIGLAGNAVADEGGPHITLTDDVNDPNYGRILGASGGNNNHVVYTDTDTVPRVPDICHNGTLGALVQDDADVPKKFILGNNHVLARFNQGEYEDGSLVPVAVDDEPIIQPGLVDQDPKCSQGGAVSDKVAELSAYVEVRNPCTQIGGRAFSCPQSNRVDAAIAKTTVSVSPEIIDIGRICEDHYAMNEFMVGDPVAKSGRTTGLSFGKIDAVDVAVGVQYVCDTCEDMVVFYFVQQIAITPGSFVGAGDSGSLVLNSNDRRPVGMVFAGSKKVVIANPIELVLSEVANGSRRVGSDSWTRPLKLVGDSSSVENSACETPIPGGGSLGGGGPGNGNGNRGGGRPTGVGLGVDPFDFAHAREVHGRNSKALFSIPGVVGTGVSVDKDANPVIQVYLAQGGSTGFTGQSIPAQIEGVAVEQVLTGPFVAY